METGQSDKRPSALKRSMRKALYIGFKDMCLGLC